MKCPTCGREVAQNEKICAFCGENNEYYIEPVTTILYEPKSSFNQNNQTGNQQPNIHHTQNTVIVTQNKSSAALVCGIIGIFFAGLIFGILSLTLSTKPNCSHPTAAKVLGIIDIVGFFIYFLLLL